MAILKALTSGGTRRELDFYPTPPEATLALVPLISNWPEEIWEPFCGDGAMSKVLAGAGYNVHSQDLIYRGYGEGGHDFFQTDFPAATALVSNPPFGRAEECVRHAHAIGVERMALLLKINYWSVARRLALWELWRPRIIAPLTWRLDFTGAGSPHTDCMWVVWERANALAPTDYGLLPKPVFT